MKNQTLNKNNIHSVLAQFKKFEPKIKFIQFKRKELEEKFIKAYKVK